MISHKVPLILWLLLAVNVGIVAQEQPAKPLFQSHDMLHIRIATDLNDLLEDIGDERKYHKSQLFFQTTAGDTAMVPVKLKARGNFRRNRSNCNCPPLRMKFDSAKVVGTPFEGQKKVKLVTHCQNKKSIYEQNLLLEYLIYRMYNELTAASFRVRLAHITYYDITGKEEPIMKYGFMIEDVKDMAARNGSVYLKRAVIHPEQAQREQANMLATFMFMIGNTDFSIGKQHNARLITKDATSLPVAVPYDFDWSGLIAAPYAKPNPILQLPSVKTRLFRGFCRTEEEFEKGFQEFRSRKEAFFALIDELPDLEPKIEANTKKYLNSFFDIINDPKLIKREFYRRCRK